MRRMRIVPAVALVVATAAVATGDPAVLRTKLGRPARGFQLRMTPFAVPVGEREVCQAVRLPIHQPMDVDRITIRMPYGATLASHHFAMFLADASAPNLPLDGPTSSVGCLGAGGEVVSPILGFVQRLGGDVIRFPKGIGVTVRPDQVLLFNSHYVNVGDGPVTLDVAVNFRRARRGAVRQHARSFQLGTTRIDVPPDSDASVTAEWAVPFAMNLVWTSSHSHKYTTGVDVDAVRGGATVPLARTTLWSEPDFRYFDAPGLVLAPGDAIRWTCRYRNPTTHTVTFGVTAQDEMCFAVGFFVTADEGPLPSTPGCAGNGLGLVCPGN